MTFFCIYFVYTSQLRLDLLTYKFIILPIIFIIFATELLIKSSLIMEKEFCVTLLQGCNNVDVLICSSDLPDFLRVLCISGIDFKISML